MGACVIDLFFENFFETLNLPYISLNEVDFNVAGEIFFGKLLKILLESFKSLFIALYFLHILGPSSIICRIVS